MTDNNIIFNLLSKYETADLFLTDQTDKLIKEISQNMIVLDFSTKQAKEFSADDIITFLHACIKNRQVQLNNCEYAINLKYFLWFDEMNGQLKACFINSNHTEPPFEGKMRFVESEHEVIYRFLTSPYLDGLIQGEHNKSIEPQELPEEEEYIWVYQSEIMKGNKV